MKLPTILLAACAALTSTYAVNISSAIYWQEDNPEAFSLTIAGVGLDEFSNLTFNQTISSPSGLWNVGVSAYGGLVNEGRNVELDAAMQAHFMGPTDYFSYTGLGPVRTRPYDYWLPIDAPAFFVTAPVDSSGAPGWSGAVPFVISSIPDFNDNSTWEWVLNIYAHGPSLLATHSVPDYGNGALALAAAAGILFIFKRP